MLSDDPLPGRAGDLLQAAEALVIGLDSRIEPVAEGGERESRLVGAVEPAAHRLFRKPGGHKIDELAEKERTERKRTARGALQQHALRRACRQRGRHGCQRGGILDHRFRGLGLAVFRGHYGRRMAWGAPQRMVLVCKTGGAGDDERWKAELRRLMPELEIRDWPDIGDPADVEFVLLFASAPGLFDGMTGLRAVLSAGAGVDGFLGDLPQGVPAARLVDPWMQTAMAAWVVHAVLHFSRNMPAYADQQARGIWREQFEEYFEPRRVGILGCGEIGRRTGGLLADLGFRVTGWTRTARDLGPLENLHGAAGLDELLAESEFLVCLLPLTPETEGLLDAGRLARLPDGAFFVNASRGRVVVQQDLVAALDSGRLGGAWLDVTDPEPLPPGDPLWRHPRVWITPHVAGVTNPVTGAALVAENIRRARAGEPLTHPVDRNRGY